MTISEIEQSIKNIQKFREENYTDEIVHEINTIEKYYYHLLWKVKNDK